MERSAPACRQAGSWRRDFYIIHCCVFLTGKEDDILLVLNFLGMDLAFNDSGVTDQELAAAEAELISYIKHLNAVAEAGEYTEPESSLVLPADESLRDTVLELAKGMGAGKLRFVCVIGIGGSHLGTQAIRDAVTGRSGRLPGHHSPELIFADTSDPRLLHEVIALLRTQVTDPAEFVINVVSKSGGTSETVVNAELIVSALTETWGEAVRDRLVVTTDENSPLRATAREAGITTLAIPAPVGGRYSVFSAVGLFPLAAAGMDIQELLQGANDTRELCLRENLEENPAWQSAAAVFAAAENGLVVHDTFFFHPELESLGKWYRQLAAESLGKEMDQEGNEVNAGLLPTVSIGSSDLHSVAQLYLGGPNNILTTFVRAGRETDTGPVPADGLFAGGMEELSGRTAGEVMDAIYEGVKIAYRQQSRRFMTVGLEDISPYTLGEFMQFKMIEVMLLGRLWQINAFDQPHVEIYKREIKRILKENTRP